MNVVSMNAAARSASAAEAPVAELRGVTKMFGKVKALDGVDLALAPGQVTSLLGPNGAGKTTAVRLMLGLLRPTSGVARLFGGDPNAAGGRRRTGVMLQVSKVPETLRVKEHVHLFSSYYPHPLPLEEVMALAGLTGLERRKYGDLSGGQKQRVLFALALCGNPSLLFLDEPTVGLDVESRRAFWSQIRALAERGRSILLTTHYLEEADALADRVVVLQGGRIIADGTPAAIKQRTAGRRIRCVTSLSREEVGRIPGVASIESDRDALIVVASDAERVTRDLLTRDPGLRDLTVSQAGLDEAFLALTRDAGGRAEGAATREGRQA